MALKNGCSVDWNRYAMYHVLVWIKTLHKSLNTAKITNISPQSQPTKRRATKLQTYFIMK